MPIITGALLLNIIWYALIFLVPFILLRMSGRIASIERSSQATTKAVLFLADDSKLSQELLCEKYDIRRGEEAFYYNGASYNTFTDALTAARAPQKA